MDNGLTVPKWVLIVWPKIPQMPQNLSAQFVCPSPKDLDFNEKRLHWASVVRDGCHNKCSALKKMCVRDINWNSRWEFREVKVADQLLKVENLHFCCLLC